MANTVTEDDGTPRACCCCWYPYGKSITITTFVFAILAEMIGFVALALPASIVGLFAMILLICSACKQFSVWGLRCIAFLVFLAAFAHVVFMVLLKEAHLRKLSLFLSATSASFWLIVFGLLLTKFLPRFTNGEETPREQPRTPPREQPRTPRKTCCTFPHGKRLSIATFVVAILAEIAGGYTGFIAGPVLGLIPMILLICTACKKYSRCGLVTSAILALLAGLSQFATAVFLGTAFLYNESDEQLEYHTGTTCEYWGYCHYDDDNIFIYWKDQAVWTIALGTISGFLWMVVVVLVYFLLSETGATPIRGLESKDKEEDEGPWDQRKARLLDRADLRKAGVPPEEIDALFPLVDLEMGVVPSGSFPEAQIQSSTNTCTSENLTMGSPETATPTGRVHKTTEKESKSKDATSVPDTTRPSSPTTCDAKQDEPTILERSTKGKKKSSKRKKKASKNAGSETELASTNQRDEEPSKL